MTAPVWLGSRWHYRRSLASRVTLLTTMAVGLSVAFVALGAYLTVRMQTQSTLDSSLVVRAETAAKQSAFTIKTNTGEVFNAAALGANAGDVRIVIIDRTGEAQGLGPGPDIKPDSPDFAVLEREQDQAIRTVLVDGLHYRVVTVPTDTGGALMLAQSLESQDQVLGRLGLVMLLFGLVGMIAAGLAGWAVARNGLRPVRLLTESVEEIARTERLSTLPVEGDDEVARLAGAFNSLVSSVDASRNRQRQLVADAGHELRTPLTSLRTNLDLLAQADGAGGLPPDARRELLGDVRAQIEELTTLIGDLIELAREAPSGPVVEPVDLAEVVERALARVRLRAPGVRFETQLARWVVRGESSALERAVTNLLDNAAKWSPPGGQVTVRLSDGVLSVADQGPGISEADLPHIFDRFYRSTESRAMPGSGLGLSIVRQVAERHGGSTRATSGPDGGALVTLKIPGASVAH
ncbi:ATP-binding region, ATPase domain protein [metagenome]|uniref:histidine kinase n=1 Tax=metagenome TaxID=256318 RepID=A0A2P2BYR0_9ZZZZ